MYMYQFGQYAWTHMILLVVFIPSSFFVSNIFDGLMWFLLPCSLVIINDIGAYLFGKQPARMFGTAPNRFYGLSLGPLLHSVHKYTSCQAQNGWSAHIAPTFEI